MYFGRQVDTACDQGTESDFATMAAYNPTHPLVALVEGPKRGNLSHFSGAIRGLTCAESGPLLGSVQRPRMTPKPSFRRPASHAHRDVTSLLGSALTENRVICQFREMVEAGCLASSGISLTTRLSCWSI
jgi:hypothetical protein